MTIAYNIYTKYLPEANDYIEQFKDGLITIGELGNKLVDLDKQCDIEITKKLMEEN